MTPIEALNVLKMIEAHGCLVIEAKEVAIKSLEKQIPKKVYHFTDDDTFETSCCGTDVTNEDYKYCPECGQLLGEVEEVREHDGE